MMESSATDVSLMLRKACSKDDPTDSITGLQLAALHSKAVDYNKTGEPAVLTKELRAKKWPHFMEKKKNTYTSKKVLGMLYDEVERVNFNPTYAAPFDKRILEGYETTNDLLKSAAELKIEYDFALRQLMAQLGIKTEFEAWSTFVMQHDSGKGDFKFHEEIGRLSSALKHRFRKECYKRVGGQDFELSAPFAVAMYIVTEQEMAAAVKECKEMKFVGGHLVPKRQMDPENMPFMSFPWLLHSELGMIATKTFERRMKATQVVEHGPERSMGKRPDLGGQPQDVAVSTQEGVTEAGDMLELFGDSARHQPEQVTNSGSDIAVKITPVLTEEERGHVKSLLDIQDEGMANLRSEALLSESSLSENGEPSKSTPATKDLPILTHNEENDTVVRSRAPAPAIGHLDADSKPKSDATNNSSKVLSALPPQANGSSIETAGDKMEDEAIEEMEEEVEETVPAKKSLWDRLEEMTQQVIG